ncbi:hypothetical protein [Lacinutrix sp. Hel_I_90]|uniref:hypothetical protein n=1 Tax=Lacinutrix sp. Hel_I_90 TaxID=1249999 RepID=UPI0005C804C5|nr:hypothetical protein [Lacinutrix sp. Hel_I_90]
MKENRQKLPELTKRVQEIITDYAKGNITKFVSIINIDKPQKVNRLFHLDKRFNSYPTVSTDIIVAIGSHLPINMNWLLLGEGKKLKD